MAKLDDLSTAETGTTGLPAVDSEFISRVVQVICRKLDRDPWVEGSDYQSTVDAMTVDSDPDVVVPGPDEPKTSMDLGDKDIITTTVDASIMLMPNNHGALVAETGFDDDFRHVPGALPRGMYCVDLQLTKLADTQVCSGESGAMIGGYGNTNASLGTFIGGGNQNIVEDYGSSYSAVFGSLNLVKNSSHDCIVNGDQNTLDTAGHGAVSGQLNTMAHSSDSVIYGQRCGAVNGDNALIGGFSSYVTARFGVALGQFNLVSGASVALALGLRQNVTGASSAALGGQLGVVTGTQSAVIGNGNWVTGNNSTAMGAGNVISANNATAAGCGARAATVGDFVVGNDAETGANQPGFGTTDANYFRADGVTQSVHVGRATDQPAADVVQAATITVGEPAVIDIGGGTLPANGATVLMAATSGTLPAATSQVVTSTLASANVWTAATTAIANGTAVTLSSTSKLPSSFSAGTTYYVVNSGVGGALNFKLALVPGGTALGSTSNGFQDGVHTATIAGLTAGRRYFVVGASGTAFNLANSLGGPALALYGTATGTYTAKTLARVVGTATNRVYFHTTNASNQSKAISFRAPPTLTANKDYDLPLVDGSAGQMMKTDGSGVMSWGPAIGAGAKSSAVDAGFLGQMSTDGTDLFVCTTAGIGGAATWKKTALSAAA